MISVSNFAIDTGDGNSAQKNNRVPKLVCSHKLVLRGISRPVFDCCSYSWWNQKPCQNKIPQILWTDIPVSWNKQYPISLALHAIPHQHTLHSSQKMRLMDSTIPNVFHQLQNLAHNTQHSSQIAKPCSYSTINPNTRFTKRKICICYSTHNPNTRFTERKICICYSTQYPTFFTNGKSLVANSTPIWDSPETAKTLLLFQSNNTWHSSQKTSLPFQQHPILLLFHTLIAILTIPNILHKLQNLATIPPTFNTKISPNKDMRFLHTEKIFILRDKCSKLSSSLLWCCSSFFAVRN